MPFIWIFLVFSLFIAVVLLLFLRFCTADVLTKAISTILVLFAGVGGIKVTPEYHGNIKLSIGTLALDGQFLVGGARTDTTILLVVLCVAFLAVLWRYVQLKKLNKT
jgi:hypothetical protein